MKQKLEKKVYVFLYFEHEKPFEFNGQVEELEFNEQSANFEPFAKQIDKNGSVIMNDGVWLAGWV